MLFMGIKEIEMIKLGYLNLSPVIFSNKSM